MLSLYMFQRITFLLLIVGSLSCNFNRCAVCFSSVVQWKSLAGVLKMPRVSNAFTDYTSIKPLNNNKKNIMNYLLCWSLTRFMFVQTLATARTAKVRTDWPYRWFWNFFNGLGKSPRVRRNKCNLYCKLWNTAFCPRSVW